jgi:putative phosphoribosyl transferase
LRAEADEVVALYKPELFLAVGLHYQDFSPTEDREIERLLQANDETVHGGSPRQPRMRRRAGPRRRLK